MNIPQKFAFAFFAVAVAAVFGGASCTCAANITGENHDKATAGARAWAKEMGLDVGGVSCANSDTDGDGYVSCTVSAKKPDGSVQIVPVECAAAYTFNTGCRAARIVPPQGP